MTTIATRLAQTPDLPQVLTMVHALAAHHGDEATLDHETLARACQGKAALVTVLVAEQADQIVGYAALCPLVQLQFGVFGMDMHHLFVVPAARRMGIAAALVRATMRQARAQGCRYVTVGTHRDNAPAAAVYRAIGFEPLPAPGPRFRIRL